MQRKILSKDERKIYSDIVKHHSENKKSGDSVAGKTGICDDDTANSYSALR